MDDDKSFILHSIIFIEVLWVSSINSVIPKFNPPSLYYENIGLVALLSSLRTLSLSSINPNISFQTLFSIHI